MTPHEMSQIALEYCMQAPIVPVLVVEDAATARPLAEALIAGGLPMLEVTLRTPAALDVIREMAGVSGGIVGGTETGSDKCVCPGFENICRHSAMC